MMSKYKNVVLMTILALVNSVCINAQDYSKMNFHFVYIDHESSTPVNKLCQRIRTLRDDAIEVEDALIIYLSDGRQSLMSFTNLHDVHGKNRDKSEAFTGIIDALQNANSHEVIAREDRKNILKLFEEHNFVDEEGRLRFNSVVMDFYVGPKFWTLGNNEKVISHLYVDLDIESFSQEELTFNVFKSKEEVLNYPDGMPFGDNNINGINQKLRILEY